MKERVPIPDFARQWTEHVEASTSPRMTDDQAEQDFWRDFTSSRTSMACSPNRKHLKRQKNSA